MMEIAYATDYTGQTENIHGVVVGASSGKEAPIVQNSHRSSINIPIAIGMGVTGVGALYAVVSLLGANTMSKAGAITLLILSVFFLLLLSSVSSNDVGGAGR